MLLASPREIGVIWIPYHVERDRVPLIYRFRKAEGTLPVSNTMVRPTGIPQLDESNLNPFPSRPLFGVIWETFDRFMVPSSGSDYTLCHCTYHTSTVHFA